MACGNSVVAPHELPYNATLLLLDSAFCWISRHTIGQCDYSMTDIEQLAARFSERDMQGFTGPQF